eukprot:CAMPEP_0181346732 /NCGR_PEP_ID=MMETSP1101-20121128/33487_1 /TAXON_ID=46948 /ORGANISM="Rhodomonas abbreviata, Strain Caron Lab Isolate" /LENGTH=101 /DNA_ID=CAMNT_0023458869 /DNA_START=159 /DNA_END=461 /DNA_ORIENTATION=-
MSAGLVRWARTAYKTSLGRSLAAYGLQHEDIMIHDHPDMEFALKHCSPEIRENRSRRLRRAMDLDAKHVSLPQEIQEMQTPFKYELQELMAEGRALREERE